MSKLRVRRTKRDKKQEDVTDLFLMIKGNIQEEITEWSIEKIENALILEANLECEEARKVAVTVEERIKGLGLKIINSSLVRELVNNVLLDMGLVRKQKKQDSIGIPKHDLNEFIFSKNVENSNVAANNPEAVNMQISETILKQYALEEVFSQEVSLAHLEGRIHIHDLGYITRVYCSAHSLEFLKKWGLDLINLATKSSPPSRAHTLTGHLNTFLSSMQAYYAGALGIGYLNIMYAPFLRGLSRRELEEEAQYLIFSCSQNAFSRGGQSLFIDFNIHTGIPKYLEDVPIIGPKGKYYAYRDHSTISPKTLRFSEEFAIGKNVCSLDKPENCPHRYKFFTYKDFEDEAEKFAYALLKVWERGDMYGHIFPFPKADVHITKETFEIESQRRLLDRTCEVASKNGSPYFVFDRGDDAVLSQCCRLKEKIEDIEVLKHPERLRMCGFQNVTINLPQCAYRSKRNIDKAFKEIEKCMNLSLKAHFQKKRFIENLMRGEMSPLWQLSKPTKDGEPYVDINKATYIIGMIGLNEFVKYMTGKELHESDDSYKLGIKVISFMFIQIQKYKKEYNLKLALEESPAESASLRLARIDTRTFEEASRDIVKGDVDSGEVYYTNSIHLAADAPVSIIERIEKQSKFHSLIESGAIVHCFVGEERPSKEAIMNLLEKTWKNTKCSQLTISPTFQICEDCHCMW